MSRSSDNFIGLILKRTYTQGPNAKFDYIHGRARVAFDLQIEHLMKYFDHPVVHTLDIWWEDLGMVLLEGRRTPSHRITFYQEIEICEGK